MAQITTPLVDGEAMAAQHPETFQIPSIEVRRDMKRKKHVKLGFIVDDDSIIKVERMWVIITETDVRAQEGWYEGVLDNDPVLLSAKCGDKVQFHCKHILSTM